MLRRTQARRPGVPPGLVPRPPENQLAPAPGSAGYSFVSAALMAGKEALQLAGQGWSPEQDVTASAHAGQALLLELIGFKRIELKVNNDLLTQCATVLPTPSSPDPKGVVLGAVRSLVRLYAGHFSICPLDSWGHQRLVEAASWGAFGTDYPSDSERQLAAAIAAFFERSIVACALTRADGADFVSGLALERRLNQHLPHFLWTLFQRTQAALFPVEWEYALRLCPPPPDPAVDVLLREVLFLLFRARLRSGRAQRQWRGRVPPVWAWADTVEALAELLFRELKPSADSGPSPRNPFLRPPPLGDSSQGGLPALDAGDLANPFLNSGNAPRQGSNLLPRASGSLPGRGRGRGIACRFEEIDIYYSRQAQSLQVKDRRQDRPEEEPEMLPIGFLGHAPGTLRDLASGHIDYFRTRLEQPSPENPSGLRLCRLTEPLEIPAQGRDPGASQVPHLLLVVDSSSSMGFNPQGTGPARGKYDLVLLSAWGLMRHISERGLGEQVWLGAINFSGATQSSGWHRANAPEPVKRVLAAYEGGGTYLGTEALRRARESAPGRFLTVMVTDGGLGNTPEALEELRRTLQAGHDLVLLHVGAANAFTQGVQQLGGTVHLLHHAQDLVGLCLDLARANYRTPESR
jgi:hypothetical protein